MSDLARVALVPLSALNAVAGLALATLALTTGDVPAWVAAPAAIVTMQGAYTLCWLTGRPSPPGRWAHLVFIGGETAGLAIGAIGIAAAIVSQTRTSHPEAGPPTVLALVAIHALAGLIAATPPRGRKATPTS